MDLFTLGGHVQCAAHAFTSPQVNVDILRLDQIHPWISGNKSLKLMGWFNAYQPDYHHALLSFGGVYSNHLHALAFAAHQRNIPLYLMVRGYAEQPLTPTLKDCMALGATIIFLDKRSYARRYDVDYLESLAQEYQALVIPEGGMGHLGEQGCYVLADIAKDYDQVWLAVGTGTTALGLAKGLLAVKSSTLIVGVNAVADQGERLRAWQQQMPAGVAWRLCDDAHFGGFAKYSPELGELIARFDALQILLDPVYTAKMVWAFERDISQLHNQRILLIHSGGVQGRRGYQLNTPLNFLDAALATMPAQ